MKRKLIKLVRVPKIFDDGFLCFMEGRKHIPFSIKRVYYILSPKAGLPRGKHAHYKSKQVLFCIKGAVRMMVDDGERKEEISLTKPEIGIFLDQMIWHEMHDMKENTVLLVLASEEYDPKDYIRNYEFFLKAVNEKAKRNQI